MDEEMVQEENEIIRVKIQQKKNKKLTIVENIPKDRRKDVLDSLKREMACGGSLSEDGTSIQLQGEKTHTSIVPLLKKHIKDCKVEFNRKVS